MITNENNEALGYLESLIGKKPTFGDHLLAIRQGEEMTQSAFAKQLGVSRHYLCDIEHNRRYVSPKTAAEFADKLGYSRKQFVRLCLQDMLNRDGLALLVDIENAA
ncbi:helix-turn-helix transcriptional regulator [Legionella fairfieldensis]|uniref:helix-turn-helix transcriptional regulator n=1 Tax=Legionella fairfieldensis TaxID=45064 RepID=UPI00048DE27D|nr:helix-turn-helix transcriptional regulator [Legionella fairfieldensis]